MQPKGSKSPTKTSRKATTARAHQEHIKQKTQKLSPNLCVDVDHGREQERQSLSRTGRGDAHHVPPQQSHGPALALDGGGRTEALLHHLPEHVLGHGRLLERHGGLGDSFPLDDDPALVAPRGRLVVGSLGHIRVLDVEVLVIIATGYFGG